MNILEQLIYSEIVRYDSFAEAKPKGADVNYTDFAVHPELSPVRAGDIFAVRADGLMLAKGRDFDSDMVMNTWYDRRGRLHINTGEIPEKLTVYFYARPRLICEENIDGRDVHVPPEFIDMFRARIRGDFYKYVNEDALAAKWTNEYNTILENFKEWCWNREALFK